MSQNIQIEDDQITEITAEIMTQILEEYPRIQSLDFSHNRLARVLTLERACESLIALNLSFNVIDFKEVGNSTLGHLKFLV